MNILYISKFDGRPWIGPANSVPKQVQAQSKIDNVLWFNLVADGFEGGMIKSWRNFDYYVDLKSIPSGKVADLPAPFHSPDLVVVEQAYPFAKSSIRKELMQSGVPYVIVPRGEFTDGAQSRKAIKKRIGNIILGYYNFSKKAIAIQCLTKNECDETSLVWNRKQILIPNGATMPNIVSKHNISRGIKCVFIGRIEPFQKGLDFLIEGCSAIAEQLKKAEVSIDVYGPNQDNNLGKVRESVERNNLSNIISFFPPVWGKEKEQVLLDADVFILTSRFEGHPMGLIEALAYGIPAIVTEGSNMRKEVVECDAGWGADNSGEGVKEAFLQMINDFPLLSTKGENARALAQRYDWNQIAKDTHAIYEELLSAKG